MNTNDRKNFAAAVGRLFAVYAESLTDAVIDAWWGALSPHDFKDVVMAMSRHACDPRAGMFRPTPAHIIKNLEDISNDRARSALAARRAAQPLIDSLEDELYRVKHDLDRDRVDPSWARETIANLHRRIAAARQDMKKSVVEAIENVHQENAPRVIG